MAEEVTNEKQKKGRRKTIGQAKKKLGTIEWQEERVQKKTVQVQPENDVPGRSEMFG